MKDGLVGSEMCIRDRCRSGSLQRLAVRSCGLRATALRHVKHVLYVYCRCQRHVLCVYYRCQRRVPPRVLSHLIHDGFAVLDILLLLRESLFNGCRLFSCCCCVVHTSAVWLFIPLACCRTLSSCFALSEGRRSGVLPVITISSFAGIPLVSGVWLRYTVHRHTQHLSLAPADDAH